MTGPLKPVNTGGPGIPRIYTDDEAIRRPECDHGRGGYLTKLGATWKTMTPTYRCEVCERMVFGWPDAAEVPQR